MLFRLLSLKHHIKFVISDNIFYLFFLFYIIIIDRDLDFTRHHLFFVINFKPYRFALITQIFAQHERNSTNNFILEKASVHANQLDLICNGINRYIECPVPDWNSSRILIYLSQIFFATVFYNYIRVQLSKKLRILDFSA